VNALKDLSMTVTKPSTLIAPYGGKLVDLTVPAESFDELKAYAIQLPSVQISPRSTCDLELLASGAFSPLDHFMGREDYQNVLDEMHLADGHLFPIPITLAVEASPDLHLDQDVALRNTEYELVGIMTLSEIYAWDRNELAHKVLGTRDLRHPLVSELHSWGTLNISGRLQVLHQPRHYDFPDLWLTPGQTREKLAGMAGQNVFAYQPHISWKSVNKGFSDHSLDTVNGTLLLQPAVGLTRLGDIERYTRIRVYRAWAQQYPRPEQILLSLLPLATRLAGPREALWQALIHRNYGADHMIVNRSHVNPENSIIEARIYSPEEAQRLVEKYSQELDVKMVTGTELHERTSSIAMGLSTGRGFKVQRSKENSNNGHKPSGLYTQPDIDEILAETHLPRHRQGVCIWFTGLSGSGKSTTAEMLTWLLMEHGRRVTVLDGDVVRTHLSKGLGFSKADRDTNVRRIGFVASELVRLGGMVICAVVSPYRAARNDVRNMVGNDQFVEVFVDTPLQICEARDVKGFYARARRGELKGFTGIDDPYEAPDRAEIILDTVKYAPEDNAKFIIDHLIQQGFIRSRQKQS